ncbi:MAG: hypothetical protein ACHREM_27645 [Polyangiales bacterium]
MMLLAAATCFAATSTVEWRRRLGLAIGFGLAPFAGPQVVLTLGVFAVCAGLFAWRSRARELASAAIGLVLGLLSFVSIISALGGFHRLLLHLFTHSRSATTSRIARLIQLQRFSGLRDPVIVVLVLAILFALYRVRRDRIDLGSIRAVIAPFALTVVAMPAVYAVVYKLSWQYNWAVLVPLTIGFLALAPVIWAHVTVAERGIVAVALAAALASGLPRRLVVVALDWRELDPARVADVVRENVHDSDRVFASMGAWYALRLRPSVRYWPSTVDVPTVADLEGFDCVVATPDAIFWNDPPEGFVPVVSKTSFAPRPRWLQALSRSPYSMDAPTDAIVLRRRVKIPQLR